MKVAALILAAGHARRFGSDKRALKVSSAQTLLEYTVAQYAAVFDRVVVVLRESDEMPSAWQQASTISVLRQQNSSTGMGDNLALGVRHLLQQSEIDAVAVALADMPLVKNSTLQYLHEQADTTAIIVPRYLDRRGHPVVFGRDFFAALEALSGDEGARIVLSVNASRVVILQTDDAGVVDDIDTVDDWQRIKPMLPTMT